jgi:hypothetical protein
MEHFGLGVNPRSLNALTINHMGKAEEEGKM